MQRQLNTQKTNTYSFKTHLLKNTPKNTYSLQTQISHTNRKTVKTTASCFLTKLSGAPRVMFSHFWKNVSRVKTRKIPPSSNLFPRREQTPLFWLYLFSSTGNHIVPHPERSYVKACQNRHVLHLPNLKRNTLTRRLLTCRRRGKQLLK